MLLILTRAQAKFVWILNLNINFISLFFI